MKQFFLPNSKPSMETFPELLDCVVWTRFVLGIFYGVWIGNQSNSEGGGNILVALNFISFPVIIYCRTILGADLNSYGSKLYLSGVIQSLATAVMIWIYLYTDSHAPEEGIFVSAFNTLVSNEEIVAPGTGVENGYPEESEF